MPRPRAIVSKPKLPLQNRPDVMPPHIGAPEILRQILDWLKEDRPWLRSAEGREVRLLRPQRLRII